MKLSKRIGRWAPILAFLLWSAGPASAMLRCEDYLAEILERVRMNRVVRRDNSLPRSWAEHGAEWERMIQMSLRGSARQRLVEAARNGDPRVAMLRRLGFVIEGERVEPPSYATYMARYEEILQERIRGGLAPANAIRPARVFVDGDGNNRFVPWGREPEAGWIPARLSDLPGPVLGQMLAEGWFPATADGRAIHDVGHLVRMLASPSYMAGMRCFFRDLRAGAFSLPAGHRELRAMHVLEGLALVPESNREALGQLLSPALREAGDRLVTVDELTGVLQGQTVEALTAHARNVMARFPALVDFHGGGVGDFSNFWLAEPSLQESFTILARRLEDRLGNQPPSAPEIARDLARLEVALWESSRVSVEQYFAGTRQFPLPTTSPLYRYYVSSGIGAVPHVLGPTLPPYTPMYRSFTTSAAP